jgi:hypothetical protein
MEKMKKRCPWGSDGSIAEFAQKSDWEEVERLLRTVPVNGERDKVVMAHLVDELALLREKGNCYWWANPDVVQANIVLRQYTESFQLTQYPNGNASLYVAVSNSSHAG